MNNLKSHSRKEHWAKVIFLVLPTWLVCFFILWISNHYFAIIQQDQYIQQAIYIGLGMLAAAVFYIWRFRFLPTFGILLFGFYLMYHSIDKVAYGEFDTFFFSVQFLIFAILFSFGWLLSWGSIRQQRFPIIASGIFFIASIYLIAKQNDMTVRGLLQAFVPLVMYTLYIFYAVQLIAKHKDLSQPYWWHLTRRLGLFILLSLFLVGGVVLAMEDEIKAKVAEYGSGGQKGKGSMLQQDKDGNFSLADLTKLRGNLGRSNELLFVARINNFFDEESPNPLYLTGFYYSKYDPETETFEPDPLLPQSDLFRPDPSKVGLYFTQTDSSVIKDALQHQHMRTVDIEVYKTLLAANEFIAPTTSYFVQPIAIDKHDKQRYRSAYRAKSYVSELNSAYFVYNPNGVPMLEMFQEVRFERLRKANDYSKMPLELFQYYTHMPTNGRFGEIAALASEITAGKMNNLDKVVAIRDYFLSKDENGRPLFKYSDNPGIPDIPSASKLNYFLFENRKGYCAYYAGATLFMLRSLGIPSRIVAGFLTQDRNAGNNKGWYWYYADQAHAWVQVYFPGYGWIDFDTTVGNEDAQNAPNPDGTPPNTPGNALFAVDGVITEVDTSRRTASIKAGKMVFKDKVFDHLDLEPMVIDLRVASIDKDSITISVDQLTVGDSATAISFAEVYKGVSVEDDVDELLRKMPRPAAIDELHIKAEQEKESAKSPVIKEKGSSNNWLFWSLFLGGLFLLLLTGLLALAFIYRSYLSLRKRMSRTLAEKAYWDLRYTQFILHQLGFERQQLSALAFAQQMDQQLALGYAPFVSAYLKLKYGGGPLAAWEQQLLDNYKRVFVTGLKRHIPIRRRFKRYWNPMRTIDFIINN